MTETMRNSKRTIGADLLSPFLDEQIVGTDSGSGVTDRLESGDDEYPVTEQEQAEGEDAPLDESAADEPLETEAAEEEGYAAESADQEPLVSEACEEETEGRDVRAAASWEYQEQTIEAPTESETDLLKLDVWSVNANRIAFKAPAGPERSTVKSQAEQRITTRKAAETPPVITPYRGVSRTLFLPRARPPRRKADLAPESRLVLPLPPPRAIVELLELAHAVRNTFLAQPQSSSASVLGALNDAAAYLQSLNDPGVIKKHVNAFTAERGFIPSTGGFLVGSLYMPRAVSDGVLFRVAGNPEAAVSDCNSEGQHEETGVRSGNQRHSVELRLPRSRRW